MSHSRRKGVRSSAVYSSGGYGSEYMSRAQSAAFPNKYVLKFPNSSYKARNGKYRLSTCLDPREHDRCVVFSEKKWSASSMISGILACWTRIKEAHRRAPRLIDAGALLEQAKAQQEALLETQDASDMWEWHMEQQQAIASQEHELLEQGRADSSCVKDDRFSSMQEHPSKDEDDEALPEWELPSWGWHRQKAISSGKVTLMFEFAFLRCRWEVNTLCRIFMQQIVRAGYSLINTLMEMEPDAVFLSRVHSSYALEARINATLFRHFENDSFDDSGLTHILDPVARGASRLQEFARMRGTDPAEALMVHSPSYEPAFHGFVATKSEELLALLPASALTFRSEWQRDQFMDALLGAAKWVWLLHRLATSSMQPTTILRVARGRLVDPLYMEAVAVPPIGSCRWCPVTAGPAVEFMIMPGFSAHCKVFRCRVYQHFMCKQ